MTKDKFKTWSLSFTMRVLTLLTIFWFIFMCYSGFLMIFAIWRTGEFSFLDTYINRICDCFMAGVITGLITRTVGNVFEFNDGSFMGTSNTKDCLADDEPTGEEKEEVFNDIWPKSDYISENMEDVNKVEGCKDKEKPKKKGWFR